MFLKRNEIRAQFNKELSFEKNNSIEDQENAAHYNLSVKAVIIGNKICEDPQARCIINPQQVACIITAKVQLDKFQIGFVYQKRKMYLQGLWVVEPDIIHPGYCGHLTIHVLNMSKNKKIVIVGEDVLELLIYKNSEPFSSFPKKEVAYKDYLNDCYKNEITMYPNSFLDINGNMKKIRSMILPGWVKFISCCIAIFFAALSLVSAYTYFNANNLIDEAVNIEKIDVAKELEQLKNKIKQLERKQ